MTDVMQIQSLLKGYRVDRNNMQTVGNMSMIPIVSDVEFTNVANANDVALMRDPTYNQLEFKNSSGNIAIVLHGWTLIDNNQKAQDRTVPYAHLIKAANAKLVPANCVQSTQAGTFNVSRVDQDSFMILPPSLRGIALKKSTFGNAETGALWDSLHKWSNTVDCKQQGLTAFYSRFQDKLDEFVAQFEPVRFQLGSIVLINGEVVAIDLMPKYSSWNYVWRALIRDSYGAEALRIKDTVGAQVDNPVMDTGNIRSFSSLSTAYKKMKNTHYDNLQNAFGAVAQLSVGLKKQEAIDELTLLKIENDQFLGQGVLHGSDHFVYLSLVSSKAQVKRNKQPFKSLRRDPYTDSDFFFGN